MLHNDETNSNLPEYKVSEVAHAIKVTLEDAFPYLKIRGEISGLKLASSGHMYFNLKDENSVLNSVCWKNTVSQISFKPEDGLEVVCTGSISTYPGRSNYQLLVEKIEIAGIGALLEMLAKRKKKLEEEGLFDVSRKKPLPFLPLTIGVITSPTGAVIKDILHRISERFPLHILLWGVLVQGVEASEQVTAAINGFNQLPNNIPAPDLIIVARGGGSIEDLWPFNEENVVRAVADSKIPIISAIGHETDVTLIDFVSDKRAPTPTAAAEIAVPVLSNLKSTIDSFGKRISRSLPNLIQNKEFKLTNLSTRLNYFITNFTILETKLSNSILMLKNYINSILKNYAFNLEIKSKLLESFHYKKILERGFALIRNKEEKLITSVTQVKANSLLKIEFHDGVKEAITITSNKITTNPINKKIKQETLF